MHGPGGASSTTTVFPGKPWPRAADQDRRADEAVGEVIELIRLQYDRIVARYGLPCSITATT
jgi:hypothetical protein